VHRTPPDAIWGTSPEFTSLDSEHWHELDEKADIQNGVPALLHCVEAFNPSTSYSPPHHLPLHPPTNTATMIQQENTFMVSNPFRTRILSGEICAVMSVKLLVSNEIAMLCKMSNIHGMFIDMEHSTQDLHAVAQLILACTYVGVSPIVRAPSKSAWHISRLLDAGAAAVVIPHVDTVAEVRSLVRAAKYAPLGDRGCTNNQPVLNFQKVPTRAQNELLNRETMLIPMIETPAAVELVDEYLAIEGVDGILIGSNDLCADMGIPGQYDDPRYQDAVTKIIAAGVRAGKPIGIGGIGPRLDLLEKFFAMGACWSLSGGDLAMLQGGMQKLGGTYAELNTRVQGMRTKA
jgi:2-keto-3-deoxy-L-rhamnonate aldolase RhmA